jgi:hypothetical protein
MTAKRNLLRQNPPLGTSPQARVGDRGDPDHRAERQESCKRDEKRDFVAATDDLYEPIRRFRIPTQARKLEREPAIRVRHAAKRGLVP